MRALLSSAGDKIDAFLGTAGFDRGPWLVVAFAAGIALWFTLDTPAAWVAALAACAAFAAIALALWHRHEGRAHLVIAVVSTSLMLAGGLAVIWARSALIGVEALPAPVVTVIDARVLERIEQPAEGRIRLVLAARNPETAEAMKVRVNLPQDADEVGVEEGAILRLKVRLIPPAPPILPGGYNFARAAWFEGYAATGSVLGPVEVLETAHGENALIKRLQRALSAHVRENLDSSEGAIAAAFASGDRGAIAEADEVAMRDAGLTHLLSISGLHVSAIIAATYIVMLKLLALWPWLALRVRLPLVASALSALAGVAYTLLTGAEVPTVRSCLAALLVLFALAIGREPLSLRMVSIAALIVLLLWPESLVGPSFQMSFAAVISIIVLHTSKPVRDFLAPREEGWLSRNLRRLVMLLVTGLVIEVALMPIVLFHFHRAGVYGALANVMAIPLTTFVSMPLIALALLADLVGAGAPFWWMAGQSLNLLLEIAHWFSNQPGAVKLLPTMARSTFALFLCGGLWLALWRGRVRLLALVPIGLATVQTLVAERPDVLVTGDGRHVAIVDERQELWMLRETRSDFAKGNILQMAGIEKEPQPLQDWDRARCSDDFCTVTMDAEGRGYVLLLARSNRYVGERQLAAACDLADIVVADRNLPGSCQPRWLKLDRRFLKQTGGLAITLSDENYQSVANGEGGHGWWRQSEARKGATTTDQ